MQVDPSLESGADPRRSILLDQVILLERYFLRINFVFFSSSLLLWKSILVGVTFHMASRCLATAAATLPKDVAMTPRCCHDL